MNYTIANLIVQLFRIYNILVIIWCVLSWIPRGSGLLDDFRGAIGMIVEPWLGIFRRFIPPLGGIDFSPIVAIFALEAIERLLLAILL
ncbi:YggT family protein [Olsenella sp. KH3B4]|uniref:YggT family protein n=1 Tax=Olsenella sp. KH3B4 TaxID=1855394 RepID=UPI0008B20ACA|nr:YggT family protein [Olsenella sp. KH3B4]MCH3947496.1 YggT family protein [Olsenella sp.]SES90674.1 YggT family protein [Olsenella sp. KH3B4]